MSTAKARGFQNGRLKHITFKFASRFIYPIGRLIFDSELKGKVWKMAARECDSPVMGDSKSQVVKGGGFGLVRVGGRTSDVGTQDRGFDDFPGSLYSKPPRGRY